MFANNMKDLRSMITSVIERGASYDDMDAMFCIDTTQNRLMSHNLYDVLTSIYIVSGKIPVFNDEGISFADTDFPVVSVPDFLSFKGCPIGNIPGHKRDRDILKSFYPIIDDNLGMYFRVALGWLRKSNDFICPVLLHLSNRDFDSMKRTRVYVPVITGSDTRMDVVSMSSETLMWFISNIRNEPRLYSYDPRKTGSLPVPITDSLPRVMLESVDRIRNETYPEFYEEMLSFVRSRKVSSSAYTCGQFLLDLKMRTA